MVINDHKSVLELAQLKLEPKSNYYVCEFCSLQLESTSKSFFNTDLNELNFIDLLNTLMIYFRVFGMELDKGEHSEIFTSKNVIHLKYKDKYLCQLSPIEVYTIFKDNTSFIVIEKNKNTTEKI